MLTLADVKSIYPKSAGYSVYKRGDIASVFWCGVPVCGPRITDDEATRSNDKVSDGCRPRAHDGTQNV